ncbi:MAG: hypothetical protein V4649_14260 [Bacteroidota bacterium]
MQFCSSCNYGNNSIDKITNRMGRDAIAEQYPKVPGEEILLQGTSRTLYAELKGYYTTALSALKNSTAKDGVKLIVVVLTPEAPKARSAANIYGISHITAAAAMLGIEYLDLSADMPADPALSISGRWTKEGAAYIAGRLDTLLRNYDDYEAATINKEKLPATFGDLEPGTNETVNDGEGPAYKLTVNKHGLRMGYGLAANKTKQRILFLGDELVYCPYLDDGQTITGQLQQRIPGKEILNAGNSNYTMDDYTSLYRDKGRYANPDIVVVCTNGGDILEHYFSQRNHFSRTVLPYKPSAAEQQFYHKTFD